MTVEQAAEQIRSGEVVAFPTETVYGLGADAWNPDAVIKIFELKGRPSDNPLIVHLENRSQVEEFAAEIPEPAEKLMDQCWPGPLTLVFKKKPEVLDAITSGLDTVALRIPDHPVALELIRQTGPLAAPSANRSGRPSPTRAGHVRRDFGTRLPLLEGGDSEVGLESTVLDVSTRPFTVLRPGKYTFRELSEISGAEVTAAPLPGEKPRSPGVKYTHYKPEATVDWFRIDMERGLTIDRKKETKPGADKHRRADESRSERDLDPDRSDPDSHTGGKNRDGEGNGSSDTGRMEEHEDLDKSETPDDSDIRDEQKGLGEQRERRKREERGESEVRNRHTDRPGEESGSSDMHIPDPRKTLLITHTLRPDGFPHHKHFDGDFEELARQLYDLFRIADYQNLTRIAIEPLPPMHAHPMIAALKNRIEKASSSSSSSSSSSEY